ncbi:FMN-dependent NADH-azoreductase [Pseudovibrio sp. SPO723]|uniref:FMN-dependent NADH-azoreductase n=1 Tax=Nesiotobacter zosterae TaxID=392721 RepID=UPI0029C12E35|nr:NAD(P)H-dependent oxidoreductase [Pseudovibrio sp. SPO723]MDX5594008.1 NAD(P)H-dependent oxidoreductase [Pseudovibrio sp. SPO723]
MADTLKILSVESSAQTAGSVTRKLSKQLIETLSGKNGGAEVVVRDLNQPLEFIDETWVGANYTAPEQRSEEQKARLALSDKLVAELQAADVIVIGSPIYNFSVPATLKAWIDLVARAGVTFRYTEAGPEGLLKGKKAYVLVASGGVPLGSDFDYNSPYIRQFLGFIGITDVEFIAADGLMTKGDEAVSAAEAAIKAVA